MFFFFNDTATTEIYTLSLHDALPILSRSAASAMITRSSTPRSRAAASNVSAAVVTGSPSIMLMANGLVCRQTNRRSEEHTSELQSRQYLVCRLLLEKKKLMFIRS